MRTQGTMAILSRCPAALGSCLPSVLLVDQHIWCAGGCILLPTHLRTIPLLSGTHPKLGRGLLKRDYGPGCGSAVESMSSMQEALG